MKKHKDPILVTRSTMPPFEEYTELLKGIWDSAWLTNMGVCHETLKKELKEYLGVQEIELFVNGHMALELAIQAMELKGEVITTPFSFASTTHAIVRNGLTPVFCDINPDDYTMDVNQIEALITDQTCAILPVHVYGNICNIEAIEEIAKRHNLKVIYDAAHTFGEQYRGRGIGSYGDISMFSFHATKVFHSIEGGAITFSDPGLAPRLYQLKNFGIMDQETVAYVGANAKMNEFQAAMGLCNLRHLDEAIAKRKALAERYHNRLKDISGIKLSKENPQVVSNYAYMPAVFDGFTKTRDEIFEQLKEQNIFARKYFYPCINAYDCYRDRFHPEDTPVAMKISKQVLTLPIYPDLDPEVVDEICDIILDR